MRNEEDGGRVRNRARSLLEPTDRMGKYKCNMVLWYFRFPRDRGIGKFADSLILFGAVLFVLR